MYNEADTRAKLIDPAIYKCGWTEEHIRREQNAGRIIFDRNGKPRRMIARADYVLRLKIGENTQPVTVALIEAKAESEHPAKGLEQVIAYRECKKFNVPFVFSSNGHLFVEYDALTNLISNPKPLSEFPTTAELQARYEAYKGFKLTDEAAKPLLMPYSSSVEDGRRYYQDAAIRAALEKIAQGGKRVLLTLATGAGKTFLAVNLLKRLSDAGQMRRALFVCDRDELRTQAQAAFQNAFGNDAAIANTSNPQKNARVIIATYQTLGFDDDSDAGTFLRDNYPEDYFSHIVIDECHRSAWGKWSEVFRRNHNAVQIGLTATPRQLADMSDENSAEAIADKQITADNLKHFGEPVYEYDIAQGIEDGYLAACEIIRRDVNIDETGLTLAQVLALKPTNALTGKPMTEAELKELYTRTDYEMKILLPDRVFAMASDLFNQILEANNGDPHQKTIIFCVRDTHARDVAHNLHNIYDQWCKENGVTPRREYAFTATASTSGNQYLADLRGSSQSHYIATTVELLTTGVDVPRLENIAFFRFMNSAISFYQMIGRGTRIFAPANKLMFSVYDYTNATRLFGVDFITKLRGEQPDDHSGAWGDFAGDFDQPDKPALATVEGIEVYVTDAGRFVLTMVDGEPTPVTLEAYRERLAEQLLKEASTLEAFRAAWIDAPTRRALMQRLPDGGRSMMVLQVLQDMQAYDLYDVLAELGYGMDARTRIDRSVAFHYNHEAWLNDLPAHAAATIRAIAAQFAHNGTDSLENPQLWQVPDVRQAGGLDALKDVGKPGDVLRETKERIFAA